MNVAQAGPRVWVVYRDNRKDMSPAEKFGQLTDMFSGRVNYERAVEQARKMLRSYKDGDYIMMVGDPALCGVVMAVALEYAEDEKLKLLRWDREDIEYRPMDLDFAIPDEDEPLEVRDPAGHQERTHDALVTKLNRYK